METAPVDVSAPHETELPRHERESLFRIPKQVSGYVQIDYIAAKDSSDQLNNANQIGGGVTLNAQGQLAGASGQSGDSSNVLLNQNRFLLRRARLRLADEFARNDFAASYTLQVDANTIAGPALGLRDAEARIAWSPQGFAKTPTPAHPAQERLQVQLGAGQFRAPFGFDVSTAQPQERLFSEQSLLASAFFPGEYDLGAQLRVDYGNLYAIFAVQNGEPIGARGFGARDPNSAKDWFLRVAGEAHPSRKWVVRGGLSVMRGTGFHAGTPATKDVLVWRDYNEDGAVQTFEIVAIRGAAPTASQNFARWAVGVDVRAEFETRWGKLTAFVEAATGVNMDRGILPADPVVNGTDQRGITIYGGLQQEIGKRLLLGVRADHYNAKLDATDIQGGRLVRTTRPFTYLSLAAGYRFLASEERRGAVQLMAEYMRRSDRLGLDATGRPADLADDRVTVRLQAEF